MKNPFGGTGSTLTNAFLAGSPYAYGEMTGANEANRINEKNYELQKANLAWQQGVQQRTWEREDTAIQRRKADLVAAGMSPVLAAGQGAQTSAPIPTTAPQRQYTRVNLAEAAMTAYNLMSMSANIGKTFAETELVETQKDNAFWTKANLMKDYDIKEYDLGIAQKAGVPYSNPSTPGRIWRDATNVLKDKVGQPISELQREKTLNEAATLERLKKTNPKVAKEYEQYLQGNYR